MMELALAPVASTVVNSNGTYTSTPVRLLRVDSCLLQHDDWLSGADSDLSPRLLSV
jgi:hypothetical protein